MNHLSNSLIQLGLHEPASDIYVKLLERGPKTLSEIANHMNLYRPATYKAIALLQDKGLVSLTLRGKQKYYVAENPGRLKNLVSDLSVAVDNLLPELETMMLRKQNRPLVRILEGKKGVSTVFDDIISSCSKGETFYRYTSELDLDKVNSYLSKDYRTKRDAKKLERLVISNKLSGTQKKSRLERMVKFLPQNAEPFNQNIIQLAYANKIAIIDLNTETSLIIENESIAHFQKVIFRTLYKNL
jgi:sugar-specific transcriptional regulator TrmB